MKILKQLIFVFLICFKFQTNAADQNDCNDPDYIDTYIHQHNCVLFGNEASCLQAALLDGAIGASVGTATGALAGSLVAEKINGLMKSRMAAQSAFMEKWNMVRNQLIAERELKKQMRQAYRTIQDMEAKRVSQGRVNSITELMNEVETLNRTKRNLGAKDFKGNQFIDERIRAVQSEFKNAIHAAKVKALTASKMTTNAKIGEALANEVQRDPKHSQARQQQSLELIKQNFPEESRRIMSYIDELTQGNLTKERRAAKIVELSKHVNKSPRSKLIAGLLDLGGYKGLVSYGSASLADSYQTYADQYENKKMNMANRAFRYAYRGGALGALTGGAAGLALNTIDKTQIASCKKALNAKDYEIDFLQGQSFLSSAKASSNTSIGDHCPSLTFHDPETAINEALETFGFVPPGMCQMMKNGLARTNYLLGDVKSTASTIDCHGTNGPNYTLRVSGEKTKFEYRDGTQIIKADMLDGYPDYRSVEIYSNDNRRLKNAELEFQKRYSLIHPAGQTDRFKDQADIAGSCLSTGSIVPCGLMRASLQGRIVNTVIQTFCSIDEKKSSSPPPAVKSKLSI
ncbi:MAG: hypothetical protein AB7N80_02420 [Bdellovibrionales bacterium]